MRRKAFIGENKKRMKFSVKLPDRHRSHREQSPPLLVRAKIPITIFNLPFLSHFSTTTAHPSDLSLSLSTNFASGPSLKLSYATARSGAAVSIPPFSLTLKSGTGLFGSPTNSPLIISASFSFNPSNPNNPSPTFSLLFKPQLGSFSLRKSVLSHLESSVGREHANGDAAKDANSVGFQPVENAAIENRNFPVGKNVGASILKGIQLAAKTEMPLANGVALNCRWWMNFAEDQMPYLRINKIGVHRINDIERKKKLDEKSGEVEMLKGMCFWMKRDLDVLTRVNGEMKGELEELKSVHSAVHRGSYGGELREGGGYKKVESSSSGIEQWRSKRKGGGEESGYLNGKKEEKTGGSVATDVENELQQAIKAAMA